jgi:hypothetical protein
LEAEKTQQCNMVVIEFQSQPNETIDEMLTRFDVARHLAASVGADIANFGILTEIFFRALKATAMQVHLLLQPLGGDFPKTQQEYEDMTLRMRQMGHMIEQPRHGNHHDNSIRNDALLTTDEEKVALLGYETPYGQPSSSSTSWGPQAQSSDYNPIVFALQDKESNWGPPEDESDSGTDSDTVSSVGDTPHNWDDVMGLAPVEVSRTLWAHYEYAKGSFGKHEQKPVPKVRRFIRQVFKTKGRGTGKGKRPQRLHGSALTTYVATFTDEEFELCFFGK